MIFPILQIPGGAKAVLSGEPLYFGFKDYGSYEKQQKLLMCPVWGKWFVTPLQLSGHFSVRQVKLEVVKIRNPDCSYCAWEHVLSLNFFCWFPVLGWEFSYANFQRTKFVISFKNMSDNLFSTCWYLLVKFGQNKWS